MEFPGKNVAVLGIGVSGYASALFLADRGFRVFVSDQGNSEAVQKKAQELRQKGIEVETGVHSSRLKLCDWAVISPGIPPSSEVVKSFRGAGKQIYSEIEVASRFCPTQNVLAVTGSSGKTTVTTLLGRVLDKLSGKAVICGNIGNPWISEIPMIGPNDYVVVEVSSFQLTYCQTFRPRVGLLLNLSQNHQDWHPDMQDYANAKLQLFKFQGPDDYAIVRRADQQAYFPDFRFQSKVLYLDGPSAGAPDNPNERAVRLAAGVFQCPEPIVQEVFDRFEGIEHRLEKAAVVDQVAYLNDSKCTTTSSLAWALEKFGDGKVILIAGGHPKSDDFASIKELVRRKVKKAILIGEARPLLTRAWGGHCRYSETDDFREALTLAREAAQAGDTVLLSPACASFDMFKNYIERGNLFKSIVQGWVAGQLPASVRIVERS